MPEQRGDRRQEIVPAGVDATLALVRHGETDAIVAGRFQGQADTVLTATGLRQAELVGARLAARAPGVGLAALPLPAGPPSEIAHSPLERTTQTAAAIAAGFVAAGRPAPSLRSERGLLEIGQGEWEGVHGSDVERRWGDRLASWRREPTSAWAPGGESLATVDERVRAALAVVVATVAARARPTSGGSSVPGYRAPIPDDQPWAILVGHDGVFKVVLLALLDLPLSSFWRFPFVLAGITIVELRDGRAILRAHNLADHLAPLIEGDRAAERRAEAEAAARERAGAL
ncbi:MAG TPA: histidine phosphatase family protein [Candidatus Limnocylindrales bacterium]|nr:histidine phosphatase family protein [Candidatus Limnocylindrales bacterium]